MPALVLFGRRSCIASDDLYIPALILLLVQIPMVILSVVYVAHERRCSSLSFSWDGLPFWYLVGAIPMQLFMACIDLMVMRVSTRGTIIDHEARIIMPRILHVHVTWSVLVFAYGVAGLIFWYNSDLCKPDAHFVLVLAGAMVAEVGFSTTLGMCVLVGAPYLEEEGLIDSDGTSDCERRSLLDEQERSMPSSEVYVPHQQRWERRCNNCCACVRCFTCNLFGGAGTQHDSMSTVANVIARLFYGSPDLVVSDIVAGFILLAAVQSHDEDVGPYDSTDTLKELRQRLQPPPSDNSVVASTQSSSNDSSVPPSFSSISHPQDWNLDSQEAGRGPVSELGPLDDNELTECITELAHYSRYAVGIYGWMLYVWSHPWIGTFSLAFTCLKRERHYIHGDNFFRLSQAALQLETKLRAHDIVFASFKNEVCRPAFCVALDHEKKKVVVSIRGTLSLEDCLTDAIAYGMSMDEIADRFGCEGQGEYAHQGFLACAEGVYHELNKLGVLEMLFNPDTKANIDRDNLNECATGAYKDYGLMLTGHSLGAGTAVLLSIMLRPKYPNLRCLAFSPPGCTLSPKLARSCESFVTSVVVGYDIIARSSLTSAEELRDQVIDLIGRSKVSKSEILSQVIAWRKPEDLLNDEFSTTAGSTFGVRLAKYRETLRRIQDSEPINELTIPGRLVHLKRDMAATALTRGCWVCCRPGAGGVCCTDRSNYEYAWESVAQFHQIQISRTMLDDHFPDKVHHVLQDCAKRRRKHKEEKR